MFDQFSDLGLIKFPHHQNRLIRVQRKELNLLTEAFNEMFYDFYRTKMAVPSSEAWSVCQHVGYESQYTCQIDYLICASSSRCVQRLHINYFDSMQDDLGTADIRILLSERQPVEKLIEYLSNKEVRH